MSPDTGFSESAATVCEQLSKVQLISWTHTCVAERISPQALVLCELARENSRNLSRYCCRCFPDEKQQSRRAAWDFTPPKLKNVHTGEDMLVLRSEPHDSAQVLQFHKRGLLPAPVRLPLLATLFDWRFYWSWIGDEDPGTFHLPPICCYRCTKDGTCGVRVSEERERGRLWRLNWWQQHTRCFTSFSTNATDLSRGIRNI